MKVLTIISLIVILFAGCSKINDVKPNQGNLTVSPAGNATKSTHDDSIHVVTFHAMPQKAVTKVSGDSLTVVFYENVDLLFSAEGYHKTYAIHLTEDFKSTPLAGFDFTTVAAAGNVTLNWVDDNLNNVTQKSITDTVIYDQQMVKVAVHRPFTFFKVYNSNSDAVSEQNALISRTADSVGFTSYCYYNQKNYAGSSTAAQVIYSR